MARCPAATIASLDVAVEHVLPLRVVPFPGGFAVRHDGRLFLASGIGPDGQGDNAVVAFIEPRPRHSLSSLLITGQKSDVRTTQDILRHSSSATTLDLYPQSPMAQRIAAQESVLNAILNQPTRRVRIGRARRLARNR